MRPVAELDTSPARNGGRGRGDLGGCVGLATGRNPVFALKVLSPRWHEVLKKYFSWVVLALLLGVIAFWASDSRMAQLSNLQVPQDTFPEVYVQMDVGSDTKCLVSGRSGTTEKRSDESLAKASWRCRTEMPPGQPPVFVADSKRQPSFLFVPFTAVSDLMYPYVYDEVRAGEDLALPNLHWVHLYYNRQFQGLYLEISLPGRHFAAERLESALAGTLDQATEAVDGQVDEAVSDEAVSDEAVSDEAVSDEVGAPEPEHLELLSAKGSALVCFDRKMRPVCPVYNLAVADGIFPRPQSSAGVAFLQHLSPPPAFSFILSDRRYDVLEPFPLPIDLGALLRREPWMDQRYQRWQEPAIAPPALEQHYAHLLRGNEKAIKTRLHHLTTSIRASCVVMECDVAAELERLAASPSGRFLLDS